MDSMDMSTTTTDTTMMTAESMAMVFFTSTTTSLYSMMWTPSSVGQYAGTCIFLIVLAVVLRALLAVKAWRETAWLDQEFNRRFVAVNGRMGKAEEVSSDVDSKRMTLTENGLEEDVMVVRKKGALVRPWRITVDPVRAVFDTAIAAVSYLLMLGVMTMNIGYFLSILAGTFLGSLALGRYALNFEH